MRKPQYTLVEYDSPKGKAYLIVKAEKPNYILFYPHPLDDCHDFLRSRHVKEYNLVTPEKTTTESVPLHLHKRIEWDWFQRLTERLEQTGYPGQLSASQTYEVDHCTCRRTVSITLLDKGECLIYEYDGFNGSNRSVKLNYKSPVPKGKHREYTSWIKTLYGYSAELENEFQKELTLSQNKHEQIHF